MFGSSHRNSSPFRKEGKTMLSKNKCRTSCAECFFDFTYMLQLLQCFLVCRKCWLKQLKARMAWNKVYLSYRKLLETAGYTSSSFCCSLFSILFGKHLSCSCRISVWHWIHTEERFTKKLFAFVNASKSILWFAFQMLQSLGFWNILFRCRNSLVSLLPGKKRVSKQCLMTMSCILQTPFTLLWFWYTSFLPRTSDMQLLGCTSAQLFTSIVVKGLLFLVGNVSLNFQRDCHQ